MTIDEKRRIVDALNARYGTSVPLELVEMAVASELTTWAQLASGARVTLDELIERLLDLRRACPAAATASVECEGDPDERIAYEHGVVVIGYEHDAIEGLSVTLAFTVYGVAQPKGNMRAVHPKGMKFPVITDSNRSVKSWSQLVAQGASDAIQQLPEQQRAVMTGAVRLTVGFYMPRPKKFATVRHASTPCVTMPDWDKLARAIGDALTKVVYRDDAQIVEAVIGKFYCGLHDAPHVDVRVEPTGGVHPLAVPAAPLSLFAGVET